jgi:hypothetical protein
MINHDFSGWEESLFKYGKQLLSYKDIIAFDANDNASLAADYKVKQASFFNQIVEAHLFWIGFGVGLENLAKAVLLKHHIPIISRRGNFDGKIPPSRTNFHDYQERQTYNAAYVLDKYQKVYQHVFSTNVSAKNNQWLADQFQNAGIQHPLEINTPTMHALYETWLPRLVPLGIITNTEKEEIQKSMEVFKLMRRNVDAHIFLNGRVIGSIDRDIEDIYLPLINLLIEIFKRPL